MSYSTTITIENYSEYSFTLDEAKSSGLTGGTWPSTIGKGSSSTPWNTDFDQGPWSWQINFEAWYNVDGTDNQKKICLQYHADGVEVFSKSVKTSPDGIFAGSSAKSSSHKSVTFNIEGED